MFIQPVRSDEDPSKVISCSVSSGGCERASHRGGSAMERGSAHVSLSCRLVLRFARWSVRAVLNLAHRGAGVPSDNLAVIHETDRRVALAPRFGVQISRHSNGQRDVVFFHGTQRVSVCQGSADGAAFVRCGSGLPPSRFQRHDYSASNTQSAVAFWHRSESRWVSWANWRREAPWYCRKHRVRW